MSDAYYLVDQNKKQEYEKFANFWENEFVPSVESMLNEYAAKRKKEKPELKEFIEEMHDIGGRSCDMESYCPIFSDIYSQRLGIYHGDAMGFVWNNNGETHITEEKFRDKKQLEEFLEKHPEISIADDCGFLMTLESFAKEVQI